MNAPSDSLQHRFQELLRQQEEFVDLAAAALEIARIENPDLDIAAILQALERLAGKLRQRRTRDADLTDRICALNRLLFEEEGFRGDETDYYDPRNSFLDQVLERRRGIPITLSVLYMEVGRRAGIELQGIPFPSHFLVKAATGSGDVFLDPFDGGVSLAEEELRVRLARALGVQGVTASQLHRWLVPAPKRLILARMLRNLKAIYMQTGNFARARTVVDLMIIAAPEEKTQLRDRGWVQERLECYRSAKDDYEAYLAACPDAEDASEVRCRIEALSESISKLN